MRILILNSEYPPIGGGAGNASACLAAELSNLGHEVKVVTSRFASLPKEEWVKTSKGQAYHLIRIPALRRNEERSNALEQGFFSLCAAWFGLPIVHSWKPNCVIAFFGVPCGLSALVWHLLLGTPYIISLRGGDVPGFRPYDFALYHRLVSPLLHIIYHRATAVVANSAGLQQLAQAFDASVPIDVIYNGVDTVQFHPVVGGERAFLQDETLQILFIGRVVYQKGLDILFSALSELKAYSWHLTIVGDGPLRESLQLLAQQLGIEERISYVGWVHREKLPFLYQQADLFVLPSRHEGMSNVVLEAMASGLAVIATDIAGNQELVVPGETGFLVPSNSSLELRMALQNIMENQQQLKDIGLAARQRVEILFSWRSVAEQYVALIEAK